MKFHLPFKLESEFWPSKKKPPVQVEQAKARFTCFFPKSGVTRGFKDQGTFAAYMDTIAGYGALVTWNDSHKAVAVFPPVMSFVKAMQ